MKNLIVFLLFMCVGFYMDKADNVSIQVDSVTVWSGNIDTDYLDENGIDRWETTEEFSGLELEDAPANVVEFLQVCEKFETGIVVWENY